MIERHPEPLGRIRRRALRFAGEQRLRIPEQPRVAERTAADHGAGTAGVPAQADDVLRRLDVAVADDRDVQRLDHTRDLVPVGRAGEHLGAGAGVERKRAGSGILHSQRDGNRIARLVVPAAAGLHRHRQVRRGDDGPDDPVHQLQVPETPRAPVALHHLLDRTAEVDVDELRLVVPGDECGRLRHRRGIGTVDLDADRPLARLELGALKRGADPAADRFGRQELRENHIRPHAAADLAERRLRHPGHGRQDEGELAGRTDRATSCRQNTWR